MSIVDDVLLERAAANGASQATPHEAPAGVGAPILLTQSTGLPPGFSPMATNVDVAALQAQITQLQGALSALAAQGATDPAGAMTAWLTNLGAGPQAAQQTLTQLGVALGQLPNCMTQLASCMSQLTTAQDSAAAAQTAVTKLQAQLQAALQAGHPTVPKSTTPPGTYVSAPAAIGAAAGSGLLGAALGWWARGRKGKR